MQQELELAEQETGNAPGIAQLSEDDIEDLTAGVTGESTVQTDHLEEFGELLDGVHQDSTRKEAWVVTIIPETAPETTRHELLPENVREKIGGDCDVAVEFLLPSGQTFWKTYTLPSKHWDESDFTALLDVTGTAPSEPGQLLGSRVDLSVKEWAYRDDEWQVELSRGRGEDDEDIKNSVDYDELESFADVAGVFSSIGVLGGFLTIGLILIEFHEPNVIIAAFSCLLVINLTIMVWWGRLKQE